MWPAMQPPRNPSECVLIDREGSARTEDTKDEAPGFSAFGTRGLLDYNAWGIDGSTPGGGAPDPRFGGRGCGCRRAARRLTLLDSAETLQDLAALPSNRLEALRGDRGGQYSIRITAQWRICFRWTDDGPCDVEIVDYR